MFFYFMIYILHIMKQFYTISKKDINSIAIQCRKEQLKKKED